MTSGETKSAKDKMEVVIKALDEYENSLGLSRPENPLQNDEIQKYLTMERNVIEKLSQEDSAAIAMRLDQYSFYLQRQTNRENARLKWAESELTQSIADKLDNYNQYLKAEYKITLIGKEDSYVASLLKIRDYANQRVIRLEYLGTSLKNLSDTMKSVQRSKYVRS